MPALKVLTQSLREPGRTDEVVREHGISVALPATGDAVKAVVDALTAAKHSLVKLTVPAFEVLGAQDVLQAVAARWGSAEHSQPARAGAVTRRSRAAVPARVLRLAAVSCGKRCVAAPAGRDGWRKPRR